MRKLTGAIALFLLASAGCVLGKSDETIEQLIARASAARVDQQPDIYMEIARREFKSATDAYQADKNDEFSAALGQIVKYSDSAHAAALRSGKHLTGTEIHIREIALRLRDLKLNVDVEGQPAVQAAIDRLEALRLELQHVIFGTGSKSEKQ